MPVTPVRRLARPVVALLGALLGAAPLAAQKPTPAPPPIVVRAARMVDVVRGVIVAPAMVVVEAGRIRSVGPSAAPAGARVIDLGDVTLLPGLIDAHTHLTGDLEGDWVNAPVKETAADAALRGARNARLTLQAGFTTVRDVGAPGFADVALMNAIDKRLVPGPRIVPAGSAIGITGGHCDVTGYAPGILELGPKDGVVDGVDEAVKAVRYMAKHGARVIKICATAGVLSFDATVGAQQLSFEEMSAIVQEAARHGLKVAAHAHGKEGILAAVRAGVASIEHGSMIDDAAIALMKQKGTYLVPTTYLADAIDLSVLPPPIRAKAEEVLPLAKANIRRAIRGGVKIALGTDAAVIPHGRGALELLAMVERGMRPADALRAATVNAADLLGTADRGVIATGKLADLIAVAGDPLAEPKVLQNVRWVMKGGEVVE
jgi:imidazolonepropionase-like amidohydrolase